VYSTLFGFVIDALPPTNAAHNMTQRWLANTGALDGRRTSAAGAVSSSNSRYPDPTCSCSIHRYQKF
jgi:hypothetical protein